MPDETDSASWKQISGRNVCFCVCSVWLLVCFILFIWIRAFNSRTYIDAFNGKPSFTVFHKTADSIFVIADPFLKIYFYNISNELLKFYLFLFSFSIPTSSYILVRFGCIFSGLIVHFLQATWRSRNVHLKNVFLVLLCNIKCVYWFYDRARNVFIFFCFHWCDILTYSFPLPPLCPPGRWPLLS